MDFDQLARRDRFEHGINPLHHWRVGLKTIVGCSKNNYCNRACLEVLLMLDIRIAGEKRVKLFGHR